ITCGLNHSLTKQRFIMMTQSHRGKGAWLRLAATLPVIAATFFAFGCGTKQAEMTNEVSSDLTNGTEATYIDMCPPCDATVSNTFGAGNKHSGIDYVLDEGDPVYAAADGEISAITRDDSNGLMLTLKHADGYETRYAHLSKVDIASKLSFKGKESGHDISGNSHHISTTADHTGWTYNGKVFKGQLIGYAGSTGRATGAHLHFELRQHGIPVDPSPFFTSDKPVKGPFMISVRKINSSTGNEYVVFCNGKQTTKDQIGNAVAEFFKGEEDMYSAVTHIEAEDNIPMGVITDIKEQLRNAQALKVRYETDDSAIEKRMPPANTEEKSDEPRFMSPEEFANDVSRRNHIFFKINSNDKVLLGTDRSVRDASEKPYIVNVEDFDINVLKRMISNPENKVTYPECETHEFTMPDGSTRQFRVSKGMVSLQIDRGTSYEGYTKAMECITTAYKELREELSSEVFGKPLAELSDAEMQVIYKAVPMNVSETEPKDIRR
ncbi:MAG: M23 family metallopeptidase, partial [Bacteroidales bacterium]|nr:M23 family metallopeptidase [Bacteroidales bacterium]